MRFHIVKISLITYSKKLREDSLDNKLLGSEDIRSTSFLQYQFCTVDKLERYLYVEKVDSIFTLAFVIIQIANLHVNC